MKKPIPELPRTEADVQYWMRPQYGFATYKSPTYKDNDYDLYYVLEFRWGSGDFPLEPENVMTIWEYPDHWLIIPGYDMCHKHGSVDEYIINRESTN